MGKPTASLLEDIGAYLTANPGITATTLGREAVNDGKIIGRLRAGGRCWPETEQRIRDFMATHSFPVVRRKAAA